MPKSLEQELRIDILTQLQNVDKVNCPKIFEHLQTKQGYAWVEEQIIELMIETGQAAAMCIPQIESEIS